jgi:hypothetical protein
MGILPAVEVWEGGCLTHDTQNSSWPTYPSGSWGLMHTSATSFCSRHLLNTRYQKDSWCNIKRSKEEGHIAAKRKGEPALEEYDTAGCDVGLNEPPWGDQSRSIPTNGGHVDTGVQIRYTTIKCDSKNLLLGLGCGWYRLWNSRHQKSVYIFLFVNTVRELWLPYRREISCLPEWLLASQKGLYSMALVS